MRAKLLDYWKVASPLVAYGMLGAVWLEAAWVFCWVMGTRLWHVGAGGLKIADLPTGRPQCDFSAFWPAGVLARAGRAAALYDPAAFEAFRQGLFFPLVAPLRFYYPPTALLPMAAISYLPFEAGFWVWTVVMAGVAILLLRKAGLSWLVVVASMICPAALWNVELGQLGVVTGCLVVYAALVAEGAPVRAGLGLGLLAMKPQAGLLVGVGFLARRRFWPGLAAAVGVAGLVVAAVTVMAGPGVWKAYFSEGAAVSRAVLEALPAQDSSERFGVSVFWALRAAGLGLAGAYAAQGVVAVGSAVAVWRAWRGARFSVAARMAVTVFCSLLATPYGYTDDMVGYSVALAVLAEARGWRIDILDAFLWLWPVLCPIVFMRTGVLLTPVVVLVAVGRVWWARLPVRGAVVTGG